MEKGGIQACLAYIPNVCSYVKGTTITTKE